MSNDRVGLLVERLSHLVREDLRAVATRHDLPLAQLEVLRFLAVANRFSDTVSGLVEYVGATKGTLSQSVNALERKGLVTRVADAGDRRVQHCVLTDAGVAIVRESHQESALGEVLDAPSAESLEGLLRATLRARGGRAFGVCRSCLHHRASADGRRCALLDVPLSDEDARRICREHVAA